MKDIKLMDCIRCVDGYYLIKNDIFIIEQTKTFQYQK